MPGDNPILDGMKIGADGRLYVTDLVGKASMSFSRTERLGLTSSWSGAP